MIIRILLLVVRFEVIDGLYSDRLLQCFRLIFRKVTSNTYQPVSANNIIRNSLSILLADIFKWTFYIFLNFSNNNFVHRFYLKIFFLEKNILKTCCNYVHLV